MENPVTSIIILAHNNFESLRKCIDSIRKYTTDGTYEIIVVDNHSTDGTAQWLQSQQDIRAIINTDNVGCPRGYNQAINIALGDAVLLMNNDIIVTPNWLKNLIQCLYSADDIGAVGPITNNCPIQQLPVKYSSIEEMFEFAKTYNISNPETWEERLKLISFCLLIKKSAIEKIGLLDEGFTPGNFEDDDLSFSLRIARYKLMLCKDTFIHNFGYITFKDYGSQSLETFKLNQKKFEDKWGFNSLYSTFARQELINFINKPKTQSFAVLDVGCACGNTLLQIKNTYPNSILYGIELNKGASEIAKTVANVTADNIESLDVHFDENYFDYILFGDVLEHLVDPWQVLLNIKRYLKPDGKILASIPNVMHISIVKKLIHGNWTYEDAGILDRTHMRFFTLKEIHKMFRDSGYSDIYVAGKLLMESKEDFELIENLCKLSNPDLSKQFEIYQYLIKASVKP
ncbi:glycosyltransferase [Lachnoclostridium phytofermentans]|uniref:Glycosyl transferase family 2 n=1 Tax=Lachnoclostridium phytofermentans (strain ATCC 700394 / DSM 18823 / ISDg) TaxID=357809 RepID=A9KP04_LACP7|nr:glycosyltransferase [Lachnoclostridium phytofermentans]ABX43174.1 glycosyl transferase family 2 [Lachnoclostridium phytofermentans ISDg]